MQEAYIEMNNIQFDIVIDILNWSLEKGRDKKYGGILSFIDVENKPPGKVEWDMKYWSPYRSFKCFLTC